jgi:hypothetical protein
MKLLEREETVSITWCEEEDSFLQLPDSFGREVFLAGLIVPH